MQNKEEFKRETEISFKFFVLPKICSICKKKIFLKDGVKIVDKNNEAKTKTTDYYCEECMKSSKDILEKGLAKPWEILAITFTNKAAKEMAERIELLVGEGVSSQMWVKTFHSECL